MRGMPDVCCIDIDNVYSKVMKKRPQLEVHSSQGCHVGYTYMAGQQGSMQRRLPWQPVNKLYQVPHPV
jgi:hypothetical protein